MKKRPHVEKFLPEVMFKKCISLLINHYKNIGRALKRNSEL